MRRGPLTSQTAQRPSDAAGIERYRQAERALWKHYGLEPEERFVDLPAATGRLRVLEAGSGAPVLFIHGGMWPATAWASLIAGLAGIRCIAIDRPGCGLSAPIDYANREYRGVIGDVLTSTLDALDIDEVHVVGQEVGAVWALGLAASAPTRVRRVVLTGAAPLMHGQPAPGFLKVLASPIGAIIVRLPQNAGRARSILGQEGHGASLEAGRIPTQFLDWHVALIRETRTMNNERAMIRAMLDGGRWRPGVGFATDELAGIQAPVLYVHGTADPEGTVDQAKTAIDHMARAELRTITGGGHLPWFDDPDVVSNHVNRFLEG